MSRRILFLNPWHGGSHRAFLDGWMKHSRHEFTVLSLPARRWKWRMRHSAVTLSNQLKELLEQRGTDSGSGRLPWDVLVCTDMLGLAEFKGLCPAPLRELRSVIYFHENQLTYPNQTDEARDLHFAYSHLTSALAADSVWFNSAFHREEFLTAMTDWLDRMPDFGHAEMVETLRDKSLIQYPGIDLPELNDDAKPEGRAPGPIRIVWASRWEHDKNPALFFDALRRLARKSVPFELNVLGESFRRSPRCFGAAEKQFASQIRHWGFAESRDQYFQVLRDSDVIVSTADHEFFGISILEAVAAGCFPVVPAKLAYPETLRDRPDCFYDGTVAGLTARLMTLAEDCTSDRMTLAGSPVFSRSIPEVGNFLWPRRSAEMDSAIEGLC